MTRTILVPFALVAALGLAAISPAATIEIQLVDVDIEYDESTGIISDIEDSGDPDPLAGIFFFLDDVPVGSLISPPDDLAIDLEVPGVDGIDPLGDTVTSDPGGSFDILVGGSPILSLALEEVDVIYSPIPAGPSPFIEFVFAGTVGSVLSQALPGGLLIGDPVTVTLSTQASDTIASSTEVLSFTASGTGELSGALVPEPTSVALVVLAMAGVATRRRR